MLRLLYQFLFKKISPIGLGIFRIGYGINFLLEILNIFNYRQLYFDKIPYLDVNFPDTTLLFLLWMVIISFLVVGYYTRISAILNYVFTIVFISSMTTYEYHMFYTYTGVNFLLIFLPIQKVLSIDFLRMKFRCIEKGINYKIEKVAKINYLLPAFVGIGLFYFDSAFTYKIYSPMWLKGLGVWLPSSIPHITISENQWFLNQEFLVKFLSYLTMLFEFMFIFLFWHKRYRVFLLLIGLGLHLGIAMEFPIPYFAMGYVAIYLIMVPVTFWGLLWKKIINKQPKLTLFYDKRNLSIAKLVTLIQCLDIFKAIRVESKESFSASDDVVFQSDLILADSDQKKYTGNALLPIICKSSPLCYLILWLSGVVLFKNTFIGSLDQISEDKSTIELVDFKGVPYHEIRDKFFVLVMILAFFLQIQVNHNFFGSGKFDAAVHKISKQYFGITHHDVFVDSHLIGYNNVYTIKYEGELLPILDERGMADRYVSGGSYAYWIFRVNMPYVKENAYSLRKGMIDYTSFWMHRNDVDLSKIQKFEIVRKKVALSFQWERDLLEKNINSPWEKVGELQWKDKKAHFFWSSDSHNK
ncbi:hypothetical protein [Aquimarina sp. SS2-1]|uniref:hypothetical protein n=1 Tax=Aquimarina besae TaxID=3342247 RepID=UPI00366F9DA0